MSKSRSEIAPAPESSSTLKELAQRHKIGRTTLYRMLQDGTLQASKFRRLTRVTARQEAEMLARLGHYRPRRGAA